MLFRLKKDFWDSITKGESNEANRGIKDEDMSKMQIRI